VTKRGLCIGCNYVGTSAALAGAVNDAFDWNAALGERDFEVSMLVDGDCTRAAMLNEMATLVQETGPDDLAVITWSGHGSWQVDRDGDEPDRRDEVICPVDYSRAGMISDDDLYRVFTSGHRWARVVFISDSCHSGSVNRLAGPLTWQLREITEDPVTTEHVLPDYRRAKFLPPAAWIDNEDDLAAATIAQHAPARGRPRASALLMAGCKDSQTAMDAWFDSRANGAFTYAALKALRELPEQSTYRQWMRQINTYLPSVDFPDQAPQLEGSSGQRRWLLFEEQGEH
jgi:hypothetical protein